jgi:hypothetical protein
VNVSARTHPFPDYGQMRKQLDRLDLGPAADEPLPEPSTEET